MKMIAESLGLEAISGTVFFHFFAGCIAIVAVIGFILFFCTNLVRSRKE